MVSQFGKSIWKTTTGNAVLAGILQPEMKDAPITTFIHLGAQGLDDGDKARKIIQLRESIRKWHFYKLYNFERKNSDESTGKISVLREFSRVTNYISIIAYIYTSHKY